MDTVTINTLVQLARANAWIPLLAVLVGGIIRIGKSDPAVARIPLSIKPENRAVWAMAIAIVGAALDRLATGGTWYEAIAGGLVAGSGAIAGHEILVNRLRKGRDIGVKKTPPTPPADWVDDSQRPPPGTMYPGSQIITLAIAALAVCGAIVSCAGAAKIACPVIDLASSLCPLILVKMADGSQELVPRDRIADTAMRVRLMRMHVEAETDRELLEIEKRRLDETRLDGGGK